jgi:hypothetical protein
LTNGLRFRSEFKVVTAAWMARSNAASFGEGLVGHMMGFEIVPGKLVSGWTGVLMLAYGAAGLVAGKRPA